jgi:putative hemolysin
MRKQAWLMTVSVIVAWGLAGCSTQPLPLAVAGAAADTTAVSRQAQCAQQGGRWTAIGRAQNWTCLVDYPDAGKACTDTAQCQGRCLVQGEFLAAGKPAAGVCQRDASQRFGCRQPVENGLAGQVLCVD